MMNLPPNLPPRVGGGQPSASSGAFSTPANINSNNNNLAACRKRYHDLFNSLDSDKDGFLTSEQVRQVYMRSRLEPNLLAHIWDLSDLDADGKLTRTEFSIGLYLIDYLLGLGENAIVAGAFNLPDKVSPDLVNFF